MSWKCRLCVSFRLPRNPFPSGCHTFRLTTQIRGSIDLPLSSSVCYPNASTNDSTTSHGALCRPWSQNGFPVIHFHHLSLVLYPWARLTCSRYCTPFFYCCICLRPNEGCNRCHKQTGDSNLFEHPLVDPFVSENFHKSLSDVSPVTSLCSRSSMTYVTML